MKLFRVLCLILSLIGMAPSAFADNVCMSSAADYSANKSKLPAVFQNLPVTLTTNSWKATAGLKIRLAGSRLKLEGHVWSVTDLYSDDAYIKQICYDGSNFKVTLDNGKSYTAEVSGNSVSIKGATFQKSSDAQFAGIVEKVKGAMDAKGITAGTKSGVQ